MPIKTVLRRIGYSSSAKFLLNKGYLYRLGTVKCLKNCLLLAAGFSWLRQKLQPQRTRRAQRKSKKSKRSKPEDRTKSECGITRATTFLFERPRPAASSQKPAAHLYNRYFALTLMNWSSADLHPWAMTRGSSAPASSSKISLLARAVIMCSIFQLSG